MAKIVGGMYEYHIALKEPLKYLNAKFASNHLLDAKPNSHAIY